MSFDSQQLVNSFLKKNYVVTPAILEQLLQRDTKTVLQQCESLQSAENLSVLSEEIFTRYFVYNISENMPSVKTKVDVVFSYGELPKKREVKDFVSHFRVRYHGLRMILMQRRELQGAVSISRAIAKQNREPVAIIGLVYKKEQTKNKHTILELEDQTGVVKVILRQGDAVLERSIPELVLDEVIGVTGVCSGGVIFASNLFFPDVPLKEYKKVQDDVSVAFISDLHVGSRLFAQVEFERFLAWLNLSYGDDEQRSIAEKVKYLIICGDLVDGVGIYPNQEQDLVMLDVYTQYESVTKYLSTLRRDIHIIVCPGNHDAQRLSEPQPPMGSDFAGSLSTIKNITLVSNPGVVRLHGLFDVLLYHGYGFDYYINEVEAVRAAGGYNASSFMMEFALRKRHISPTHVANLYVPDPEKDPLILECIPDIFVSGHIHYDAKVEVYKNVTLISSSSFQYKTAFQEKLGHINVVWGRVPILNLKTRQAMIMDFR